MIRLLFALSVVFGAAAARADSLKDSVSNIEVVGEAGADVAPDRATLRFSVVTERPTAQAAAEDNSKTVEAVLAALRAEGVADADLRTQGFSLTPYTIETRDAKGKPKTEQAYRAANSVSAVIEKIEGAGDVTAKVIAAGANSLEGVDYDNADLSQKRDALRAAAVKDAERRAKAYAEAVGLRLSRVLEIRPVDDAAPMPRAYAARIAADAAAPVPLRPGTRRIVERVSITWALSR